MWDESRPTSLSQVQATELAADIVAKRCAVPTPYICQTNATILICRKGSGRPPTLELDLTNSHVLTAYAGLPSGISLIWQRYARNIQKRVTAVNEQAATDTLERGINTKEKGVIGINQAVLLDLVYSGRGR